jgi:hypothetical protein
VGDELAGQSRPHDRVICHSGYEYPERPVALYWQGQRLEIEEIEDEWRTPEGKKFRVHTSGEQMFDLFYRALSDEWQIIPV